MTNRRKFFCLAGASLASFFVPVQANATVLTVFKPVRAQVMASDIGLPGHVVKAKVKWVVEQLWPFGDKSGVIDTPEKMESVKLLSELAGIPAKAIRFVEI